MKISSINESDAKKAGHESLSGLKKDLSFRKDGEIYKIHFKLTGPDPRVKLREQTDLSKDELNEIVEKLDCFDKYSKSGDWKRELLNLIAKNPGSRSLELANIMDTPQDKLKLNVRKLKNLGVTISLGTGYKISPRGKKLINKLK